MADTRTPKLLIAGAVRLDPARREAAIAAASEMMRETRREPGCITYTMSADVEDPGRFWIFEEWESEQALAEHFASPHMRSFQTRVAELGVVETSLRRYAIGAVDALG